MLNFLKVDKEKVSPWGLYIHVPAAHVAKKQFSISLPEKIELNLHSVAVFSDFQPLQGRDKLKVTSRHTCQSLKKVGRAR